MKSNQYFIENITANVTKYQWTVVVKNVEAAKLRKGKIRETEGCTSRGENLVWPVENMTCTNILALQKKIKGMNK